MFPDIHCDLVSFHLIDSLLFLHLMKNFILDLMGEVYFPLLASKPSGVTSDDLARPLALPQGAYLIYKYTIYMCVCVYVYDVLETPVFKHDLISDQGLFRFPLKCWNFQFLSHFGVPPPSSEVVFINLGGNCRCHLGSAQRWKRKSKKLRI